MARCNKASFEGGCPLIISTAGGVIDRLEIRGLIERHASEFDRRVRLLTLTSQGVQTLREVTPLMLNAQEKILSPLSAADQKIFMKLLSQLVNENNEFSRVPSQTSGWVDLI